MVGGGNSASEGAVAPAEVDLGGVVVIGARPASAASAARMAGLLWLLPVMWTKCSPSAV